MDWHCYSIKIIEIKYRFEFKRVNKELLIIDIRKL